MSDNDRVVDVHAMLGEEGHLALQPAELLRRMDAHGIELAIARPMGSGLVVDNRAGNDLVLSAGPRIRGMVSVNPWWGDRALEELSRCYEAGAVGLFLDPLRQGFYPTDSMVAPIYDRAAEFNLPVMFRTGGYIFADVLAVTNVARKYPQLDFIFGCGGYADMWFEIDGAIGAAANLFLDASLLWSEGIEEVINKHGAGRVLFGGSEPRNRYQVNLKSLERLELDESTRHAILCENAQRIFRLEA